MIYALWLIAFLTGSFLPWWTMCLWAVLIGFWGKSASASFLSGALGLGMLWTIMSYFYDLKLEGIVSQRLSGMFSLSGSWLSYILAGAVAAVLGGTFCWLGYELGARHLLSKQSIKK